MSAEFMELSRSLEALHEPVRDFLRALTGLAEGETGQLFVDRAHWLYLERAAQIIDRARIRVERAGAAPRRIAPNLLVSILEGASLEENEELSEGWAGLLSSAAAGTDVGVHYPKLLAEMGPDEYRILDTACKPPVTHGVTDGELVRSRLQMPEHRYEVAMDNLYRLGLFIPLGSDRTRPPARYLYPCLTPTAVDLMRACRGPSQRKEGVASV